MTTAIFYALVGVILFSISLYSLIINKNILKKIISLNIMGSAVFLIIISLASRNTVPDPVPHAMVITGIVVAVSATAVGIFIMLKLSAMTGKEHFEEEVKEITQKDKK